MNNHHAAPARGPKDPEEGDAAPSESPAPTDTAAETDEPTPPGEKVLKVVCVETYATNPNKKTFLIFSEQDPEEGDHESDRDGDDDGGEGEGDE